jgi:hypothetical protein
MTNFSLKDGLQIVTILLVVTLMCIFTPFFVYFLTKFLYPAELTHAMGINFALAALAVAATPRLFSSFLTKFVLQNRDIELSEMQCRILFAFDDASWSIRFLDISFAILLQKFIFHTNEFPLWLLLIWLTLDICMKFLSKPRFGRTNAIAQLETNDRSILNPLLQRVDLVEEIKGLLGSKQILTARRRMLWLSHLNNRQRKTLLTLIANNAQTTE